MNWSEHWKRFLSESADIQGGAFFTTDGVLISWATFGDTEYQQTIVAHCAAVVAIANQLTEDTERSEFDVFVLEGEYGYVVLMPVLDKAILAVLARKQAKLGLVLLDMRRAIGDGPFGPGLATDPILFPQPPKHGTAQAKPEQD